MKASKTAIGVDIIEIQRIKTAVYRWQDAFLRRVYSDKELEHCGNRYPSLAARFAAKEAVIKTLGAEARGLSWKEIEILPGENDAPYVELHGNALIKAEKLGFRELSISMSHCKQYVVAMSVGNE